MIGLGIAVTLYSFVMWERYSQEEEPEPRFKTELVSPDSLAVESTRIVRFSYWLTVSVMVKNNSSYEIDFFNLDLALIDEQGLYGACEGKSQDVISTGEIKPVIVECKDFVSEKAPINTTVQVKFKNVRVKSNGK